MKRKPLTRQEVIDVIDRKQSASAVPLVLHKWWGSGLSATYGDKLVQIDQRYPDDILMVNYQEPGMEKSNTDNPEYRLGFKDYSGAERHSIGESVVLLPDWSELDDFIAHFPDPYEPHNFDYVKQVIENDDSDRYRLGAWWLLFHERLWSIRGMENLMLDYYDNMEGLKILGNKIVEYSKAIVDQFAALGFNGIFSSDDLGHQTGPMMSPDVFEELYLPLYKELVGYIHSKGMHFFLHSCGDNTKLLDFLIEAGVDVLHPIQKGTMDMAATAERFGDRITFLAGMDVQSLLPNGTPDEVRQEIKHLKEIFQRPGQGGLLLGAGNGILSDTPLENIDAMLDEMSTPF